VSSRKALGLLWLALLIACRTPDGPRVPIPDQALDTVTPDGMVRVVFFNRSNKVVYPTSGSVRIQVDGQTLPTVHHDRYAQVFLPPGRHDLLLEHWDMVVFTSRYTIELREPQAYFAVFSRPVSTGYEEVPALPPDFAQRWLPAKYPTQWAEGR
jgi:hypothetical protein